MTAAPGAGRAVLVHGIREARAALDAAATLGVPVTLLSAPAAAAHGGAGWFMAVIGRARAEWPAVAATAVLDCDDRAGDAQGALADAVPAIVFTGRPDVAERLRAIAAERGATVLVARPDALDLRDARDPVAACRLWLGGGAGPDG